jgi:electron transfer flavoprotein beta subunit
MKALVPIKRVPDYQSKIVVKPDGSGIDYSQVKWIVNPFDEIAVEEALKLREIGKVSDITVVSIGPDDAAQRLRYTMGMGADRAIHIKYDGEVDSDLASRAIAEIFRRAEYKLIIMGKQAIDSDANQTAQLLAARLSLPQATFASRVVIEGETAQVTREVDGGLETISVALPCIISTDLRLNTPRYVPLPGIMQAKKKPLEELTFEALSLTPEVKVRVKKMTAPAKRQSGKKVESIEALVKLLKEEAKVI